ncbi:J domain-containing protein [Kineosporia babensis]|uniref:DnaJ domain-containing protein n=1 Tax=Kineosporia babensis TaxID=499548 RepID=A0A9X1SXH7_9ACTN|nr:J domain-containing protein [Kineosporia babensis]MCD5315834.1 DnaJ domain-containing protein [Kineosporia babensis]
MGRYSDLGGRTAYEVLQLPESAPAADVVKAYRRRQREVHPDLGGDRDESAQVAIAYRWLTRERPDYDDHLRSLRGFDPAWGTPESAGASSDGFEGPARDSEGPAWDGKDPVRDSEGSVWDEAVPDPASAAGGEQVWWGTWEPEEVVEDPPAPSSPESSGEKFPDKGLDDEPDDLWARVQADQEAKERWREGLIRAARQSRQPRERKTGRRWSFAVFWAVLTAVMGLYFMSIPLALWMLFQMWRFPESYRGKVLMWIVLVWSVAQFFREAVTSVGGLFTGL